VADERPPRIRVRDVAGRAVKLKLRYLIPIALGVLVLVAAIFLVPVYVTSTPSFCSNCHVMDQYVSSWELSTHNRSGCVSCHVKPGFWNLVLNQMVVSKNIYLNIFGKAEMPQEIRSATNQNCLQGTCHTTNRKVSTSGDLLIPHQGHVEMRGLECKDCHFNVVHTATGGTPRPPMGVCAMCHNGTTAPNACTTCHVNPPSAQEAHPDLALETHAAIGKGRARDCYRCHHASFDSCTGQGCHDASFFETLDQQQQLEERNASE
jgi:nitrate/TMAO reductase-like tetraheme cytochrome c subunit